MLTLRKSLRISKWWVTGLLHKQLKILRPQYPRGLPGDDSWHFLGFQSSLHGWLISNVEQQDEPLQLFSAHAEVTGHSSDVYYHLANSQVAVLPYQLSCFQQPDKWPEDINPTCLFACATSTFILYYNMPCKKYIWNTTVTNHSVGKVKVKQS